MLDLDDVPLNNENPFPAILQGDTQGKIVQQGFSIKFHCGAFETIPHAKLHILTTE